MVWRVNFGLQCLHSCIVKRTSGRELFVQQHIGMYMGYHHTTLCSSVHVKIIKLCV